MSLWSETVQHIPMNDIFHKSPHDGVQDSKRTSDAVATTAAVVIFWPAAFFVGGDKQTAAELGLMKGQMVAIEQASVQKKCGIQFQRPPAS